MDLQIIKIASANKNQKILKKYTHEVKNKNSICGDEITIKLLISSKIIKDIGYDCKSCVFCQASVNLLSKKIINMNSNEVINLCDDAINFYKSKENKMSKKLNFLKKILTENNYSRKECLLLPFETLRKGLRSNYGKN
tara:strand:+ start:1058 stop:1471 length:414 start_codon:yes stop_codon:yes gene_type:complete